MTSVDPCLDLLKEASAFVDEDDDKRTERLMIFQKALNACASAAKNHATTTTSKKPFVVEYQSTDGTEQVRFSTHHLDPISNYVESSTALISLYGPHLLFRGAHGSPFVFGLVEHKIPYDETPYWPTVISYPYTWDSDTAHVQYYVNFHPTDDKYQRRCFQAQLTKYQLKR